MYKKPKKAIRTIAKNIRKAIVKSFLKIRNKYRISKYQNPITNKRNAKIRQNLRKNIYNNYKRKNEIEFNRSKPLIIKEIFKIENRNYISECYINKFLKEK